jgi:D-amino-acid dehydrogenase
MSGGPAAVPSSTAGFDVAVVGAGVVGACCALALARRGLRVALIEPGPPGGAQAASHGNGGWISPASVVPMSTPGLWRRLPGLLTDRDGPLTVRPAAVPGLAPWLWRFVRAGSTRERVQRIAATLAVLLRDAPARHARLAALAGLEGLIHCRGLLYAYRSRAELEADAEAWQLRRGVGVEWIEWGREAASRSTPVPAGAAWPGWLSARYAAAAWVPAGAHCSDPGAYVAGLVATAERLGVVRLATRVHGWQRGPTGRLAGLRVDGGGLPVGRAVLAAGIASGPLAAELGLRIPLASERGYHVVLPWQRARSADAWRDDEAPLPVMPADGRMAVTLTPQGLRLAGQVELAAIDAAPDWRRADVLWRHAAGLLNEAGWDATGLGLERSSRICPPSAQVWMGHRPSTPDGLPAIGACPTCPDVVFAFGHGHVGLATAPLTADWVAEIIATGAVETTPQAASACAPSRFGSARAPSISPASGAATR